MVRSGSITAARSNLNPAPNTSGLEADAVDGRRDRGGVERGEDTVREDEQQLCERSRSHTKTRSPSSHAYSSPPRSIVTAASERAPLGRKAEVAIKRNLAMVASFAQNYFLWTTERRE